MWGYVTKYDTKSGHIRQRECNRLDPPLATVEEFTFFNLNYFLAPVWSHTYRGDSRDSPDCGFSVRQSKTRPFPADVWQEVNEV